MRTVTVFLTGTTPAEVEDVLDELFPAQREPWVRSAPDGDPVVYLNLGELANLDVDDPRLT